ncbi:MAG: hypothetical protein P4M11_08125, partial [Candidatus Pacebacteria bacterium]|nr:hypothetical protein [Candidatus Paceibacterota bacterium]
LCRVTSLSTLLLRLQHCLVFEMTSLVFEEADDLNQIKHWENCKLLYLHRRYLSLLFHHHSSTSLHCCSCADSCYSLNCRTCYTGCNCESGTDRYGVGGGSFCPTVYNQSNTHLNHHMT